MYTVEALSDSLLLYILYCTPLDSKMHLMSYNLAGKVNPRLKSVKFAEAENTGLSRSLQCGIFAGVTIDIRIRECVVRFYSIGRDSSVVLSRNSNMKFYCVQLCHEPQWISTVCKV